MGNETLPIYEIVDQISVKLPHNRAWAVVDTSLVLFDDGHCQLQELWLRFLVLILLSFFYVLLTLFSIITLWFAFTELYIGSFFFFSFVFWLHRSKIFSKFYLFLNMIYYFSWNGGRTVRSLVNDRLSPSWVLLLCSTTSSSLSKGRITKSKTWSEF